ncbi:MAG: hypothetical protein MRZ66_05330, partial [Clostridiales bacterium]|nr:hypothetical protein [Clostridiales bacterium]
ERGNDTTGKCLVMLNFSDCPVENYSFRMDSEIKPELLINSDFDIYSGSTECGHTDVYFETENTDTDTPETVVHVNLPPFSGQIFLI